MEVTSCPYVLPGRSSLLQLTVRVMMSDPIRQLTDTLLDFDTFDFEERQRILPVE